MAVSMTLPKIGFAFLGVAGASGLGVLIKSQFSNVSKKETFRDRYKHALFNLDASSTDSSKIESKWGTFKTSGTPKSDLLKESKTLSTSNDDDSKAKYREGCKYIYDSEFSSSGDLWDDFKAYCSRTNADAFDGEAGKEWVVEAIDSTVGTDWSARLKSLKENSDTTLPKKLEDLKKEISTGSYSVTQANSLKTWCEEEKVNPFEGSQSNVYKYLGIFCRKTT